MRIDSLAAFVFVLLSLAAAPTLAQAPSGPADAIRANFYGTLRFAGETSSDSILGRLDIDMDPGFGGGARLEIPLMDYIVVGGSFQIASLRADGADDRQSVLDFSGWIKGRYVLPNVGRGLELYLGLGIGLSIAPDVDITDDTEVGWNLQFLPGAQYFVTGSLGLLFEFGFTRHHFDADGADLTVLQGTMNVGISAAF